MTETKPAKVEQLTTEQIIARYGQEIRRISEEKEDNNHRQERSLHIARARRNWRMVDGDHFLAPGFVGNAGEEVVDWVSVEGQEEGGTQRFAYAINILGADARLFQSVMGQTAPRVQIVPDDIDDPEEIDGARKVKISSINLQQRWRADTRQAEISFHQFVTGPVFLYTPFEIDEKKNGFHEIPNIEMDPATGAPIMGEPMRVPRGDAELYVYNSLHVDVPFGRREIPDAEWLKCQTLESKFRMLARYREQLKNAPMGGHGFEENIATREAIQAQRATAVPSGVGEDREAQWVLTREWWDTAMFEGFTDSDTREFFKQHFPDGAKFTWVRDKLVDIEGEDKNEVWAAIKPGTSEYIMSNARCHDSIPFQRAFDDLVGLIIEIVLRSVPKLIVDAGLIDHEALNTNEPTPYEVIPTLTPASGNIAQGIAPFPTAKMPDQSMAFMQQLRIIMQDVNGMKPELAGGGQPTSTYREAKQRKDQAMLTLSTPAACQRSGWEIAYRNGNKQRARFGMGQIKAKDSNGPTARTVSVDMESIPLTGWHVEADDSLPMTFTERVDRLLGMIKENPPEVVAAMGVLEVQNIKKVLSLVQLDGFTSYKEMAFDREMRIINRLLAEPPIENVDPATGMPIPGQPNFLPTVEMDPILDDPQFVLEVGRQFAASAEGQRTEEDNPDGYRNFRARLEQAQTMIQAAQAPPQQAPEGAGGNGEAPEGAKKEAQAEPLPQQTAAPPVPPPAPAAAPSTIQ